MSAPPPFAGMRLLDESDRILVLSQELPERDRAAFEAALPRAELIDLRRAPQNGDPSADPLKAATRLLRQRAFDAVVVAQDYSKLKTLALLVRAPRHFVVHQGRLVPFSKREVGAQQAWALDRKLLGGAVWRRYQAARRQGLARLHRAAYGRVPGMGNDYSFVDAPPLRDYSAQKTVSIILPVYNRRDILEKTIAGLLHQSYPKSLIEVIIADDGSRDHPEALIERYGDRLQMRIVAQEDLGFRAAKVRNEGIRAARGEIIVLLDCDMLPAPDLVQAHLRWFHGAAAPLVVIGHRRFIDSASLTAQRILQDFGCVEALPQRLAPEEVRDPQTPREDWRVRHYRSSEMLKRHIAPYRFAASGNLAFPRALAMEAGLFDERYSRWGGEDIEFAYRMSRRGAYFVPSLEAVAYHQEHGRGHISEEDVQTARRMTDSRIAHLRKHEPGARHVAPSLSIVFSKGPASVRAAQAALGQSFDDLEIISRAQESLRTVAAEDSRLRLVEAESADSTDALIEACRGEYLLVLHPDDRLMEQAALLLLEPLRRSAEVVMAIGGFSSGAELRAGSIHTGPRVFRIRDYHRYRGADVHGQIARRGFVRSLHEVLCRCQEEEARIQRSSPLDAPGNARGHEGPAWARWLDSV